MSDEMEAYLAQRRREGAFVEDEPRRRFRPRISGSRASRARYAGTLSGEAGPAPADTTAPLIFTAAAQTVEENATLSVILSANEGVSWSIVGGADQAEFEISGSTLRWASNGTKDFESPDDAGTNNTYVVQVRATDGSSNTSNVTITVTVTDVDEGEVDAPTMNFSIAANSQLLAVLEDF